MSVSLCDSPAVTNGGISDYIHEIKIHCAYNEEWYF